MHTHTRRLIGVLAAGACAAHRHPRQRPPPWPTPPGAEAAASAKKPASTTPARRCRSSSCRSTTSTATSSRRAAPRAATSSTTSSARRRDRSTSRSTSRRTRAASSTSPPTSSRRARATATALTVAAGDLDRRLAAALGRVPRRADHRVDEQARPRRHRGRATTSSTRATRSSSGWPTAAASPTATAQNNQNSCPDGTFRGADFDYLAANVEVRRHRQDDPAAVRDQERQRRQDRLHRDDPRGHARTSSPRAASPGLEFTDEVADGQRARARAQAQGRQRDRRAASTRAARPASRRWTDPERQGRTTVNPNYDYTCGKGGSADPASLADPADRRRTSTPQIDMVVSGHTHQPYVCDVKDPAGKPRLVTSASSFGRLYTETNLTYDRRTRDIVRSSVKGANMQVTRDVEQGRRADVADRASTRSWSRRSPARSSATITHRRHQDRRTPRARAQLGDLIADAQLADDVRRDRRQDAGDRVHEPRRHPDRPDLRQLSARRGAG